MKALKLQLVPSKKQYNVLDEMFGKWASILNRYNRYVNLQQLEENVIKEKWDIKNEGMKNKRK